MPWSISEHQQEPDRLAHLLYWQELVTPSVVWQKDGSLLSVIRYRGPDMESATALELQILTQRVHELLHRYDAGWAIHVEARRHQASPYPVSTWTHPVAALVDEERRAQVGMPGSHFETTYHISMTYRPPKARQSWWHNLWWEHVPEGHAQMDAVVHFEEDMDRLSRGLSGIMHEATLLTNDALVTYLKSTVSTTQQQVRMPSPAWYLDTSLTDMPLLPGATPRLGEQWLRLVHVKNTDVGYPDTSYPGILDVLHDLPLEYRYVVRWLPMERGVTRRHLRLLERIHKGPEGEAAQFAVQATNARAMLEEGTISFGYLTKTAVVWDTDFAVADEKRKMVEHALQSQGFVSGCETFNSVESWLGTIPGDCYHNVRKPLLHSLNLVHLMPTTSVWAGPEYVPHLQGPPLLVGTARGETPFRLNIYDGDVGHTLVLGVTGSGKSTLLAFMALQWDRYHGRIIAFDKGQSLRCATAAMEGSWMNMAPGETSPLQPLVAIDQEQERAWAAEWIGDLLILEKIALTVSGRKEVWTALTQLAEFERYHRTISGLCGLLQSSELRQALEPYTMDGAYGALVDGDRDNIAIQRWQCFEMEILLQTPRIVPAMLGVLFHLVENALDGTPTLLLLDEAWVYLDTPIFAARIREWLKTFRRKNCAVVFSTQSLADTQGSLIAAAVNESCVTRIFCPNPRALEPGIGALYENYGITKRQRELIALAIPKREYYYQGREGQRLFKLELGPITQIFCGRSRVEDLTRIQQVQRAEEPFGVAWLREEGMPEMADTLKQSYDKERQNEDTISVHYTLDPFVVA